MKTEPGIILTYQWRGRFFRVDFDWPGRWAADVIPHGGVALGNVATHGNIGAAARFGWNVAEDFGPPGPEGYFLATHTYDTQVDWTKAFLRHMETYGFLSAEGRAVARNIFFDGNTFRSSHSVSKEPFVSDVAAGLVVRAKRLRLAYSLVNRSIEYRGQDRLQRFASVALSYDWN